METTNDYLIPYLVLGDAPDIAGSEKSLAEAVDTALGGIEAKVPIAPIDWYTIPLQNGAADGGAGQSIHRVRRTVSGQIEVQYDVDVSALGDGNFIVGTLPSWAIPTQQRRFPVAMDANIHDYSPHLDFQSSSDVELFKGGADNLDWFACNVTYTP